MPKYKFYMNDAWGDDYTEIITAENEEAAYKIAVMMDDDATPRDRGQIVKEPIMNEGYKK